MPDYLVTLQCTHIIFKIKKKQQQKREFSMIMVIHSKVSCLKTEYVFAQKMFLNHKYVSPNSIVL